MTHPSHLGPGSHDRHNGVTRVRYRAYSINGPQDSFSGHQDFDSGPIPPDPPGAALETGNEDNRRPRLLLGPDLREIQPAVRHRSGPAGPEREASAAQPGALAGHNKSDPESRPAQGGCVDLTDPGASPVGIPPRPLPPGAIVKPTDLDVLLGRGRPFHLHPGNQKMHRIVEQYRSEYLRSRRLDRVQIATIIVQELQDAGGRFLKKDETSSYWRQVSDTDASKHVNHLLRRRPNVSPREVIEARTRAAAKFAKISPYSNRSVEAGRSTDSMGTVQLRAAAIPGVPPAGISSHNHAAGSVEPAPDQSKDTTHARAIVEIAKSPNEVAGINQDDSSLEQLNADVPSGAASTQNESPVASARPLVAENDHESAPPELSLAHPGARETAQPHEHVNRHPPVGAAPVQQAAALNPHQPPQAVPLNPYQLHPHAAVLDHGNIGGYDSPNVTVVQFSRYGVLPPPMNADMSDFHAMWDSYFYHLIMVEYHIRQLLFHPLNAAATQHVGNGVDAVPPSASQQDQMHGSQHHLSLIYGAFGDGTRSPASEARSSAARMPSSLAASAVGLPSRLLDRENSLDQRQEEALREMHRNHRMEA